ncbi:MAG: hypothetical protein E7417_03870 [Ruminococcaceae bacterium]|nr:hypothetical protein [Oscillospiraceae bacterium]
MHSRKLGIILSYVNTFINMVSGLFLSMFLLRWLGAAEYGTYQAISSFANYLVLFEFGTGTVMTRNISLCRSQGDEEAVKRSISTIWGITLILTALILLISFGFYSSIGHIYQKSMTPLQIANGKNIFIFVTVFLVVSFFKQTLFGVLLAYEKYTLHSIISILRNVVRVLSLIMLIVHIPTGLCIAIVDAVIGIVIFLALYVYCKKALKISFSVKNFDFSVLKGALPLCLAIFIQTIVNQANNNVDKFIIGVRLSPEMVSLYSIALFVFNVFSSITTIPISMYGPQIIKAVGEKTDRRSLAEMMIAPSRIVVLMGGSIVFGFVAAGRQFVEIAYGSDYTLAWIIGVILMTPKLFNMANEVVINVLHAENKLAVRSSILVIMTLVNIALTFWWIELWGLIGATFATAVSIILGLVVAINIYYSKYLKIPVLFMLRNTFRGILPCQILAAACGFVAGYFVENVYVSFVAAVFVYMVIFCTAYLVFGATDDEKKMVKKVTAFFGKGSETKN